jgi:hypothetical protein
MCPACQPPPIRDRKLNHDTLAMARVFQQTALMFAFKGRRAVFYSAAADCADRWCAQQETGPEDAG